MRIVFGGLSEVVRVAPPVGESPDRLITNSTYFLTDTNETCGGRLNAQTRILPLTSVDCLLANGFSRLTLQKIVN